MHYLRKSKYVLKDPMWPCWFFLLVGTTLRIDLTIIGRLAVGELLMLVLIPFALTKLKEFRRNKFCLKLVFFIGLWVLGVVLSDIVNDTSLDLFMRGLARPLIALSHLIVGFYLILKNKLSVIYLFFGLLIAGVLNYFMPMDFRTVDLVSAYDAENISYGYYAYVWTPLFYGITTVGGYFLFRLSPIYSGIFQASMGVVAFPIMSRTTGAVFIVSGLLVVLNNLFPHLKNKFIHRERIRKWAIGKIIIIFLAMFCLLYYVYASFAAHGMLGQHQLNKFAAQSSLELGNTPWGMLLSGRHYTLGAILRIADNPFFGAGSWPKQGDTMIRASQIIGKKLSPEDLYPNKLETGHSILFGIWAQNGPLVLPFFLAVLLTLFRLTLFLLFSNSPLKALILPYLILLIFSVFFNNYNSLARIQLVVFPLMFIFFTQTDLLPSSPKKNKFKINFNRSRTCELKEIR